MNIKNIIKHSFVVLCTTLIIVICFSCKKSADEIVSNDKQTSDTTVKESEEVFVPEDIDISDVEGDLYKKALIKIDELNHRIGKPIYVSKDDYYKYKDVKVSLIGDSIAEYSKTHLNRCFRHIVQDSVPGREMVVGIEAFDAMKKLDRIGDIMILSLGNNAMKGIDEEVLEHVYQGIEGRPLIIPTIVMPYVGQERNRNRDLINFVNSHDNCYIADWNKIARMSDTFITEDGVHPTGDGSAAYAQLLFKTMVDILEK